MDFRRFSGSRNKSEEMRKTGQIAEFWQRIVKVVEHEDSNNTNCSWSHCNSHNNLEKRLVNPKEELRLFRSQYYWDQNTSKSPRYQKRPDLIQTPVKLGKVCIFWNWFIAKNYFNLAKNCFWVIPTGGKLNRVLLAWTMLCRQILGG